MSGLTILTWHVHGSYLHYLAKAPHRFLLPVKPGRPEGHGGRAGPFPWGPHVVEVPADRVREQRFDLVLTQSRRNRETDRFEQLSPAQLRLPHIHLEHDPPRDSPTDSRHFLDDPETLLVHVTHYNALMWDNGRSPVAVVPHGVDDHGARWTGDFPRGLSIVNGLGARGRRLGADVFARARGAGLPLDLVGMGSEGLGGLGEVPLPELPAFAARYRFFFHPVRHTSLALALCEAMMLGMPIVALATTELAATLRDGENGFSATDETRLHAAMRALLADAGLARAMGARARATALTHFGLDRFHADWNRVFADALGRRSLAA
jgi:glycosyltransferase involved in cell wall biosynthesis